MAPRGTHKSTPLGYYWVTARCSLCGAKKRFLQSLGLTYHQGETVKDGKTLGRSLGAGGVSVVACIRCKTKKLVVTNDPPKDSEAPLPIGWVRLPGGASSETAPEPSPGPSSTPDTEAEAGS